MSPNTASVKHPPAMALTAADPNSRQIGGSHYFGEYQHWDYASDLCMRHLEGACTKYLSRAGNKPGEARLKDLEKARHYLEKLLHTYQASRVQSLYDQQGGHFDAEGPTARFIAASMRGHAFTPRCVAVLVRLSRWGNAEDLKQAILWLDDEIEEESKRPKGALDI